MHTHIQTPWCNMTLLSIMQGDDRAKKMTSEYNLLVGEAWLRRDVWRRALIKERSGSAVWRKVWIIKNYLLNSRSKGSLMGGGWLTEAGVLSEKLCELFTFILAVAAVAAVAVGRDADFGGAQVVGSHHGTCRRRTEGCLIHASIASTAQDFLQIVTVKKS